ncbi:MAG: glycoside hydrolase family 20 zincin-like fold domain-containing protein [Bryobacteraceae bacterium]
MRILAIAWIAAASVRAADLSGATVVAPASLEAREKTAVRMLVEEVEKRSQIRWPVAAQAGSGASISIAHRSGPAEGYSLRIDGASVRVEGNDARGVLFGVGRLLRVLRCERGRVEAPDRLEITTAPKTRIRGHQLGYRPKTNSYDGWTLAQWEQYIRDLAVFGANAIELIPPRSDDDDDSPHFPLSKIETMIGMSKICDEYGLDVWIWYPALDPDYSKADQVEFALKEWAEVFRKLPRIDAVFVPGGDPGHTQPKYLMPLLEKQAASLRKFHPKAQMWVAPQGFSTEWLEEFYGILRAGPQWLDGIVFGPQIRVPLAELRKQVPARYPIRHYPDITHSLRAQYPVPDWDPAYQLTLNREPINPRPVDEAAIFRYTNAHTVGFITYSEGCNDDVNKIVWSGLGWDPDGDVVDTLRDYGRYFIGARLAEGFAQGLLALEQNWRGPLIANEGVYTTLARFEAMDRDASPAVLANWRFQQAQYRAHYDAYVRARLIYESQLEQQARDKLREAGSLGSVLAMREAEAILDRARTHRAAAHWRARTFELAEALFQSIRMQLSVEWYKAIAVGRGANLDLIDTPLNNRAWLVAEFARIGAMGDEAARVAEIRKLLDRASPGPGGFYDDLGQPGSQPHLISALPYKDDPANLTNPLAAMHNGAKSAGDWPLAWLTVAESRDDSPIRMRYEGLDVRGRYKVRVVYAGEDTQWEFRLMADATREVHGWRKKDRPAGPVEFAIPPEATADGKLELEFQRRPGMGGNGRAVQVAEVWLLPDTNR